MSTAPRASISREIIQPKEAPRSKVQGDALAAFCFLREVESRGTYLAFKGEQFAIYRRVNFSQEGIFCDFGDKIVTTNVKVYESIREREVTCERKEERGEKNM